MSILQEYEVSFLLLWYLFFLFFYCTVNPLYPRISVEKVKTDGKSKFKFDKEKERPKVVEGTPEDAPENVALKPLMPWIAAALYKFIDEHFGKVIRHFMWWSLNLISSFQLDENVFYIYYFFPHKG